MAFLFDDSLIPSGPSSMLKHHDLIPGASSRRKPGLEVRPSLSQGSNQAAGREACQVTPAHLRPQDRSARTQPGPAGRGARGHGRSGSVDSCIDINAQHQAPFGGPVRLPRHGSEPHGRGAGERKTGHGRRHSAGLHASWGSSEHPFAAGDHQPMPSQAPKRKHTAPPAVTSSSSKNPILAAPSLPMPGRKGSGNRPPPHSQPPRRQDTQDLLNHADQSAGRKFGAPVKASGRFDRAPLPDLQATLRIPSKPSADVHAPRSGTYATTFVASPHPYSACTPQSGATCPSSAYSVSSSRSAGSSDSSSTARPSVSKSDLLTLPDVPADCSAGLALLIPAERRVNLPIPPGSVHVPSLLLALGYILEILVYERAQLRTPFLTSTARSASSPASPAHVIPPTVSARRTLLCPHTKSLLWRLIAQHLASLSTLLVPLLEKLQSATYSRQVEACMDGARAYILKIRKVFGEVVGLYGEQYTFLTGWWEERWVKVAAREIGRWCEILGA